MIDGVTKKKQCPNCKSAGEEIDLIKDDPYEVTGYYIGDHQVIVSLKIVKGHCPKCKAYWEEDKARLQRDEAFREAIDKFWKHKLELANVTDTEMASVMYVVTRLMKILGDEKKRLVAGELGRWLAGCQFER